MPLIPAVLYGLWWLGWGHEGGNQFTFDNLATAPAFVLDGYAASLSSLLGFATPDDGALEWGRALLAAGVVLAVARVLALGRIPRGLWVVLVIGVVFWILIALNASFFRSAETSRYQFLGVVFVLMAAAELARGLRPGRAAVGIALAVAVAAVAGNLLAMRDAYNDLRALTPVVRGDLAGLEIAADRVDPALVLDHANSGFDYFTLLDAGSYLSASEKFGSPAYDQAELAAAPEAGRAAADKVLGAALGLRLDRASLTPAQAALCRPLDGGAPVTLPAGRDDPARPRPGAGGDLTCAVTRPARRRSSSATSPRRGRGAGHSDRPLAGALAAPGAGRRAARRLRPALGRVTPPRAPGGRSRRGSGGARGRRRGR